MHPLRRVDAYPNLDMKSRLNDFISLHMKIVSGLRKVRMSGWNSSLELCRREIN